MPTFYFLQVSLLWCRLGLLYLSRGDIELAHETFVRAHVIDSSNALACGGYSLTMLKDRGEIGAMTLGAAVEMDDCPVGPSL